MRNTPRERRPLCSGDCPKCGRLWRLYHVVTEYVDAGYTAGTGAAGERLAAAVKAVDALTEPEVSG